MSDTLSVSNVHTGPTILDDNTGVLFDTSRRYCCSSAFVLIDYVSIPFLHHSCTLVAPYFSMFETQSAYLPRVSLDEFFTSIKCVTIGTVLNN